MKLGCKKTPLRQSYYCQDHIKLKEKHAFKYRNDTIFINLEEIVVKRGRIKQSDLIIYDAYVDQYDNLLLLVDYSKEEAGSYFWVSAKQISAAKIESYSEQLRQLMNTSYLQDLSCNSTKIFTLPCNKKTRTVGIWLACYTCGLIASYRVDSFLKCIKLP